MVGRNRGWNVAFCWLACVAMCAALAGPAAKASAGEQPKPQPQPQPAPWDGWYNRAVGGVLIDQRGMLENATVDALGELRSARAKSLQAAPSAELNRFAQLRKISLKKLDAQLQRHVQSGDKLPDEVRFLAGLQQIRYIFVDPKSHDIVLAGPAEGWKLDAKGNLVGATTGRPVLLLDDLLVALRSADQALRETISCSIDPTPEGLNRLRAHVAKLERMGDPQQTAAGIEQALGPQRISITGVPAESHFARTLVAADYRMKRLGMNFEPAPIKGLPSYLHLLDASGRGLSAMLPRWWLAPEYQALLRDAEGLSWELRGSSVKVLAEEDFLGPAGQRAGTAKAGRAAAQWADNMTRHYEQLALADPVFGQVRNCADLAVVGALIAHENLLAKAGCQLPTMFDPTVLPTPRLPAPQQVPSKVSMLKKNDRWVISASGGVKIDLRTILKKVEMAEKLETIRKEAELGVHDDWWWN